MPLSTTHITCPYCHNIWQEEVCDFLWHEVSYTFWSDCSIEGKDWYTPSYIKLCPQCGHYFVANTQINISDAPWPKSKRLTFQQIKQAVSELADGGEQEVKVRIEAWYIYNDYLRKVGEHNIQATDKSFNQANMQCLLNLLNPSTDFSHLFFELLRLLGHRDACLHMIENWTYENYLTDKEKRYAKRGAKRNLDDALERSLYNSQLLDLKEAITKPLQPYIK